MKNSSTLVLIGGYGFVGRNILDVIARDPGFSALSPVVIDDLSNAAPGHETLDLPAYVGGYQDAGAVAFLDELEPAGEKGRIFVFLAGETRVAESKDRPMDFIDANIAHPSRFVMEAVRPGASLWFTPHTAPMKRGIAATITAPAPTASVSAPAAAGGLR